jgi:hypothetical protein
MQSPEPAGLVSMFSENLTKRLTHSIQRLCAHERVEANHATQLDKFDFVSVPRKTESY